MQTEKKRKEKSKDLKEKQGKEKKLSKKKPAKNNGLPDWLDKEMWAEWEAERIIWKKPLTERAIKIQFNILKKYSKSDQRKIMENSISNKWVGLWPLKENKPKKQDKPSNIIEAEEGKYDAKRFN
jgi:hypothetical protein